MLTTTKTKTNKTCTCTGCYPVFMPNQLAHSDVGGCLYYPPIKPKTITKTKTKTNIKPNIKTNIKIETEPDDLFDAIE
jgi:hypothetical protein